MWIAKIVKNTSMLGSPSNDVKEEGWWGGGGGGRVHDNDQKCGKNNYDAVPDNSHFQYCLSNLQLYLPTNSSGIQHIHKLHIKQNTNKRPCMFSLEFNEANCIVTACAMYNDYSVHTLNLLCSRTKRYIYNMARIYIYINFMHRMPTNVITK